MRHTAAPPPPEPSVVDEHFVPLEGNDLEHYARRGDACSAHHLVRYHWATRVLADLDGIRSVLDLGSGSGYGSSMLAHALPGARVLASDYDAAAIDSARATYFAPNLEFRHGDVTRWDATIGTERFDAITCFDVIEHVVHREIMMENLIRHLDERGALLLSTPCGSVEPLLEPEWPAHRIEYGTANLFDFLSRYFRTILRPEADGWPHREIFEALAARGIDYALVLNPVVCRDPIRVANPYRRA